MVEIIDEGKITGAIDLIDVENIEKITEQMKKCICHIYTERNTQNKRKEGTGFFCKIPFEHKTISVLMTNYHVINDEYLKNNKKIKITINDEEITDTINLNENMKIYSSVKNEYDLMIIKLEKENDIYHYLELDDKLFKENSEKLYDIYEDRSIYILHYPKGNKLSVSFGYGIKKVNEYYFSHLCNTEPCSSGSPILNLKTNKVIGIHKGAKNNNENETVFNIGILLKHPLDKLKAMKKSEIKITINIDEKEINKDIYFLDNTDGSSFNGVSHLHDNLTELNESNTELYINEQKFKYQKYFKPESKGIYSIKLKFNVDIKDCSFMFYKCYNITDIDLSHFNPENLTDMSYMFGLCNSIKSIPDISKWDTKNVTNLSYIFRYCNSLETLPDISKWDTSNVTDMSYMFASCKSLKSLPDISHWDTKNVTKMNWMFFDCSSLKSLPDISIWDIGKANEKYNMFIGCENIIPKYIKRLYE